MVMKMPWVDEFKEKIESFSSKNPDYVAADRIRKDPKYTAVLDKLQKLYNQRKIVLGQLEKCELDIQACLIVLAHADRKEEINKEKETINPSSRIN